MNNNIKELSKNKYTILLISILSFAFIIRLYYMIKFADQAVWWDAADYLSTAKYFAGHAFQDFHIDYRRPFLLPLIWSVFFRLGASEFIINLTELIFSVFGVYLTYLVGKELFNKETGLIAAFLMSIFWSHLFWTPRFMVDIPSATLLLASFYFFWKGYVKKEKKSYVYLWGLFLSLAVFTRASTVVAIIPFGLYILIKDKLNFLKNKQLWLAFLIFIIIISPFVIYTQIKTGDAFKDITGIGTDRFSKVIDASGRFNTLKEFSLQMPAYLKLPFFLLTLIGLTIFINLFLSLDLIFKNKEESSNNLLLLFLWVFGMYIILSMLTGVEERYLMSIFPMIFILTAQGTLISYNFLKNQLKNTKHISKILIFIFILIFVWGTVSQLSLADSLIKSKAESYYQVKEAGLWLKGNTPEESSIISASRFQNIYYSERSTYGFTQNESDFKDYIKEKNVKYVIISVFESGFTPQWTFEYPQKHPELLKPAQVYTDPNNNPLLIIYEVTN